MNDKEFMQLAIDKAEIEGTPFITCIIKNSKVVSCEPNKIKRNTDPTAHAEMQAIRVACKKLKTVDLAGCTMYTICQPCAMCLVACYWANIDRIVYGATIDDVKREWASKRHRSGKKHHSEFDSSENSSRNLAKSKIKLTGRVLRPECISLLKEFASL